VTKAERTIGTPGVGQAADDSGDDQYMDEAGAEAGNGDGERKPTGDSAADAAAADDAAAGTSAETPVEAAATGTEPETRPDAGPESETEPEPDAEPTAEAASESESETESAAESTPEAGDESAPAAGAAPTGLGLRRVPVLFGVAVLAYLLDIISKTLVVQHLEKNHSSIQLLGQYLQLEAVRNSGAAFGIGQGMTIVFTVIALVVIGVIARLSRRLYSVPWAIALGLLLGGALGNLTDRIFRSPGIFRGAVVDFIAPKDFAVFNLADSAIVCGGVLIVWLSFRGLDPDGSVHRD
jgi:signal peptidase II